MDPAQLPDRFILLFFRKSHNDQVPTENTVQYDMVSYGEYALITIAASRFEKDHVIQCSATRKRSMFIRIITEWTATARPLGRDMGCNLWFDTWYISCFSQTQCCVKYLVIMDRVKTALDCIKFYESNEARLKRRIVIFCRHGHLSWNILWYHLEWVKPTCMEKEYEINC